MGLAQGRRTIATGVDHKTPHKQNPALFFDYRNTQSLCKAHHDSTKQHAERTAEAFEVDENGWPIRRRRRRLKPLPLPRGAEISGGGNRNAARGGDKKL